MDDGENEPGNVALSLAGSTMGPAGAGAGGFGSGFFEPMGEDRLGICCRPAVGQHLLQTQVIRMQAEQEVADDASGPNGADATRVNSDQ